mmetsp:Transcript_34700/g.54671  ORF Transcript_34700/g.54671 Transcript_34700/m.54671 type:complete len:272 (-) Transcript_34700:153-968(-)
MMGADARYWPWRAQIPEKQAIYADYKNIQKPLPSPPPGQTWMKQENNEWVLVPCEVVQPASGSGVQETSSSDPTNEGTPTIEEDKRPTFLEHIILPSDTLTGICLRYRCKPAELRRLNNFFGDNFRLCQKLIIPVKEGVNLEQLQQHSEVAKVQAFCNDSRLGPQEARYYLGAAGWDLASALRAARDDRLWETAQQPPPPQQGGGAEEEEGGGLRRRRRPGGASGSPPETEPLLSPEGRLDAPLLPAALDPYRNAPGNGVNGSQRRQIIIN